MTRRNEKPWQRRASLVVAFGAGLLFAMGLGVSGMSRPSKVIAFLDVTGAWDPSLAFVMAGAIGVHLVFALRAKRAKTPRLASIFVLPAKQRIDAALLLGSVIFGVGWGLVGYCPGPAVVASASGKATPLAFLGAMIAGMLLERAVTRPLTKRTVSEARPDHAPAPPDLPSAA